MMVMLELFEGRWAAHWSPETSYCWSPWWRFIYFSRSVLFYWMNFLNLIDCFFLLGPNGRSASAAMVPGPARWGWTLQIVSNCFLYQTWSHHCKNYDLQVLGLTVRVLEDLPLLLNPLAILTLRWIMCELCPQHTIITGTLVQIFLIWCLCTLPICTICTICTICRPGRDTPEPKGESLLQVKRSEVCLSSRKDRCVFE